MANAHDVLLVLGTENFRGEVDDEICLAGIKRLQVEFISHTRNPVLVPGRALALARAVRKFRPDIIHCQETSRDYLALALPFLVNVPMVLTVHDPDPHSGLDAKRRNRSRHRWYIQQLRRRADWAIVHGESLIAPAEAAMPRLTSRISAVPHGALGGFMQPLDTDWEPGLCLFFGRIEEYKGLPLFLQAIRELRDKGIGVRGLIAGRGTELDRLRPEIAGDPAFEIIEKYLSPAEVREVFRRANVVVMPYREATQSGVAAYALGLGRPIVATNVGALSDMVVHQETGLLISPGSVAELASAIRFFVAEHAFACAMAKNAVGHATNKFGWKRISEATAAIYRKLLP